jgi:hypothetical protein
VVKPPLRVFASSLLLLVAPGKILAEILPLLLAFPLGVW